MGTQQRKGQRASTAKKKPEVHNLKAAYIIPQEGGDQLIETLSELPMKYSQMIGPILDMLQKTFRGDITVTIDPNKPTPTPALGPQAGQAPGEIPPKVVKHPAAKPTRKKAPAKWNGWYC